jgi:hypothetical protein
MHAENDGMLINRRARASIERAVVGLSLYGACSIGIFSFVSIGQLNTKPTHPHHDLVAVCGISISDELITALMECNIHRGESLANIVNNSTNGGIYLQSDNHV